MMFKFMRSTSDKYRLKHYLGLLKRDYLKIKELSTTINHAKFKVFARMEADSEKLLEQGLSNTVTQELVSRIACARNDFLLITWFQLELLRKIRACIRINQELFREIHKEAQFYEHLLHSTVNAIDSRIIALQSLIRNEQLAIERGELRQARRLIQDEIATYKLLEKTESVPMTDSAQIGKEISDMLRCSRDKTFLKDCYAKIGIFKTNSYLLLWFFSLTIGGALDMLDPRILDDTPDDKFASMLGWTPKNNFGSRGTAKAFARYKRLWPVVMLIAMVPLTAAGFYKMMSSWRIRHKHKKIARQIKKIMGKY